jgi:hypothetical protein
MPELPVRHPAVWTLAILGAAGIILAIILLRLHRQRAGAIYRKHFAENLSHERLLYASVAFSVTFAVVRILTHAIRAGRGPFQNITMGGRHIHHLVWGILLLLFVGYCWLWRPKGHERTFGLILAALYGIGAALTLDEFALWLNLRDVYWEREGRASIDAVLLFGGLLAIGIFGGRFFHELTREAFGQRRMQDDRNTARSKKHKRT